jgi:hypothetical protein
MRDLSLNEIGPDHTLRTSPLFFDEYRRNARPAASS